MQLKPPSNDFYRCHFKSDFLFGRNVTIRNKCCCFRFKVGRTDCVYLRMNSFEYH